VFESNPPRRFFLELRSSLTSVATLPSEGSTALLDPVDGPAFVPKENVAFAAESVGAAGVSLFVPKLNFGACAELEVAKLPNNCAPLLVPVDVVGAAVTPTLGDGEEAGAALEDPKEKGFGAASEDAGGGGELWAAVDLADGVFSLAGAPK